MSRGRDDFDNTTSKIDALAVMNVFRSLPWTCLVCLRVKLSRQRAADLVRSNFGLRVFARAARILSAEVRVHAVDRVELPVASDVIIVGMRIQDDNWQLCEFADDRLDVADAHPRVELNRFLLAQDEIADGFFGLVRFIDGEHVRSGLVDFEPRIADIHAFKRFVFGAREGAAPVGSRDLREQVRCRQKKRDRDNECDLHSSARPAPSRDARGGRRYMICMFRMICVHFTTSGMRVAGGVLRLRWMLTAPSVTTMPTPGKSPF